MKKALCFIHLPKCGGSSILNAIAPQTSKLSGFLNRFQTRLNPEYLKRICHIDTERTRVIGSILTSHKLTSVVNTHEVVLRSRKVLLLDALLDGYQVVLGHVPIDAATIEAFEADYNFVSVLRQPIDRWISHYTFHAMTRNRPEMLSFDEVVKSLTEDWGRINARTFAAFYSGLSKFEEWDSDEGVERAIANLNGFRWIGFIEDIEEVEKGLGELLGRKVHMKRVNKQGDRSKFDFDRTKINELFNDELRSIIGDACRRDIEIFSAAKERWSPVKPAVDPSADLANE